MFDPAGIASELRVTGDAELARIEEAGLNTAQPPEQLLVDGWLLRFSPGKARRARSVNAIAAGRLALDDKLALCRHWYGEFRLPLLFRITPFSQPAVLDDFLAAADFVAFDDTRVMTHALRDIKGHDDGLRVADVDVGTFVRAVGALRASPEAQIDAHLRRLQALPHPPYAVRLVVYEHNAEESPVAAGQVVVERDLAGLYDIVTAAHARERGYGRAISLRLLGAARALGARIAYLQVDAGNAPARHIYAALGFADRYAYWYRRPSGATDEIPL